MRLDMHALVSVCTPFASDTSQEVTTRVGPLGGSGCPCRILTFQMPYMLNVVKAGCCRAGGGVHRPSDNTDTHGCVAGLQRNLEAPLIASLTLDVLPKFIPRKFRTGF